MSPVENQSDLDPSENFKVLNFEKNNFFKGVDEIF